MTNQNYRVFQDLFFMFLPVKVFFSKCCPSTKIFQILNKNENYQKLVVFKVFNHLNLILISSNQILIISLFI